MCCEVTNPLQPGPIYFMTPRKCGIFGISCEGIPRQINYLIDEAVDAGKGANTVVSLLHHFFETHSLGENHVHLHADNCVGQNKNNTMMNVSSVHLNLFMYLDFYFVFLVSLVEGIEGPS